MVDALPLEAQTATFAFGQEKGKEAHWGRDKNIRDVYAHLYEWQVLLQNFVKVMFQETFKAFTHTLYLEKLCDNESRNLGKASSYSL